MGVLLGRFRNTRSVGDQLLYVGGGKKVEGFILFLLLLLIRGLNICRSEAGSLILFCPTQIHYFLMTEQNNILQ
jgi:hypothetical protein